MSTGRRPSLHESAALVHIHSLRPPDREEVFHQELLLDDEEVKITLARDVPFEPPIRILGEVALERGSDAVWFTFPGAWHDIGRFHSAGGTFTGIYANILTPPRFRPGGIWETTDLFLDLWIPRDGEALHLLDEDQFEEALQAGWISGERGRRARNEVERIREGHRRGEWPPAVVEEWTRERALAVSGSAGPGPGRSGEEP